MKLLKNEVLDAGGDGLSDAAERSGGDTVVDVEAGVHGVVVAEAMIDADDTGVFLVGAGDDTDEEGCVGVTGRDRRADGVCVDEGGKGGLGRQNAGAKGLAGHGADAWDATEGLAEALVIHEKEGAIADDGSAEIAAETGSGKSLDDRCS